MLERPFAELLKAHWADPRYEETLALLIALHAAEGRVAMVEAALRAFVARAHADHAADPQRLWSLGRSPLRTVLHLVARAAASPGAALPISLADAPVLLCLAIASDQRAPAATLAKLARAWDRDVRQAVAQNTTVLLEDLADNFDHWAVRYILWRFGLAIRPVLRQGRPSDTIQQ